MKINIKHFKWDEYVSTFHPDPCLSDNNTNLSVAKCAGCIEQPTTTGNIICESQSHWILRFIIVMCVYRPAMRPYDDDDGWHELK